MTSADPNILKAAYLHTDPEVEDQAVSGCFLTTVFHYWTERNAFHGALSTDEPGIAAFALEAMSLQDRAERERRQGTHFRLEARPAIALLGHNYDLVLVDQANNPFAKSATFQLAISRSMHATGKTVIATASSGLALVTARGACRPSHLPFRSYESHNDGHQKPLGWWRDKSKVQLDGPLRLIAQINLCLQESAS